jgi:TatA/E family protein of Tat protein translocase
MPFNVGPMEVIIVLAVALIILGPKRLPDAGRALGSGIRNLRRSLNFDTPHIRTTLANLDARFAARDVSS